MGLGNSKVSGILFADDGIGMSNTPELLQKQIDAAIRFAQQMEKLSVNEKNRDAVTIDDGELEPVEFTWKWGDEKVPGVDQNACLQVKLSKDYSRVCTRRTIAAERAKSREEKLHLFFTEADKYSRCKHQ